MTSFGGNMPPPKKKGGNRQFQTKTPKYKQSKLGITTYSLRHLREKGPRREAHRH